MVCIACLLDCPLLQFSALIVVPFVNLQFLEVQLLSQFGDLFLAPKVIVLFKVVSQFRFLVVAFYRLFLPKVLYWDISFGQFHYSIAFKALILHLLILHEYVVYMVVQIVKDRNLLCGQFNGVYLVEKIIGRLAGNIVKVEVAVLISKYFFYFGIWFLWSAVILEREGS